MAIIVPLLLLGVLVPIAIVVVAIGPFLADESDRNTHRGYGIADLLLLVTALQYPLLAYKLLGSRDYESGAGRAVVTALLCVMVAFVWARGVQKLNALAVERPIKRAVFVLVLMPTTVVLSIAFWPLVMFAANRREPVAGFAVVATAILAAAALAACLRLVGYWVLAGRRSAAPPIEPSHPLGS